MSGGWVTYVADFEWRGTWLPVSIGGLNLWSQNVA